MHQPLKISLHIFVWKMEGQITVSTATNSQTWIRIFTSPFLWRNTRDIRAECISVRQICKVIFLDLTLYPVGWRDGLLHIILDTISTYCQTLTELTIVNTGFRSSMLIAFHPLRGYPGS